MLTSAEKQYPRIIVLIDWGHFLCCGGVLLIPEAVSRFKKFRSFVGIFSEIFANLDLSWKIEVITGQYRIPQNSAEMDKFCNPLKSMVPNNKLSDLIKDATGVVIVDVSAFAVAFFARMNLICRYCGNCIFTL